MVRKTSSVAAATAKMLNRASENALGSTRRGGSGLIGAGVAVGEGVACIVGWTVGDDVGVGVSVGGGDGVAVGVATAT